MNQRHVLPTLFLATLSAMVSAHEQMVGPLPKDILEHSGDLDYLMRSSGFKSPAGSFGLHYYFALDRRTQELVLKLLDSPVAEHQRAALRVVAHCGGFSDHGLDGPLRKQLSILSTSERKEFRELAGEALTRAHRKSCSGNRLYLTLRILYKQDLARATSLFQEVGKESTDRLFDFVATCRGSGIGGAWDLKKKLPPHERLNPTGFIDWKFRFGQNVDSAEREFLEWYLVSFTNTEPEDQREDSKWFPVMRTAP